MKERKQKIFLAYHFETRASRLSELSPATVTFLITKLLRFSVLSDAEEAEAGHTEHP